MEINPNLEPDYKIMVSLNGKHCISKKCFSAISPNTLQSQHILIFRNNWEYATELLLKPTVSFEKGFVSDSTRRRRKPVVVSRSSPAHLFEASILPIVGAGSRLLQLALRVRRAYVVNRLGCRFQKRSVISEFCIKTIGNIEQFSNIRTFSPPINLL